MATKRLNREGSIRQRKDGRWETRITTPEGRRSFYGRTADEVRRKMAAATANQDRGVSLPGAGSSRMTVRELMALWLEHRVQAGESQGTTLQKIADTDRLYVSRFIGHVRVADLSGVDGRDLLLTQLYGAMRRAGYKPWTIRTAHTVLRPALGWAQERGWLPINPIHLMKRMPKGDEVGRAMPVATVARGLVGLRGHRWEALFTLGLLAGLRWGELAGLRWSSVDLEAGVVVIERALATVRARYVKQFGLSAVRYEKAPKTDKGRRTILLPQPAVEALSRHLAAQQEVFSRAGKSWTATERVFQTHAFGPIDRSDLGRCWHEFQDTLGIPRDQQYRPHDQRHTAATNEAGANNPKATQARIGHSSLGQLLDYQHATLDAQRPVVQHVEQLLAEAAVAV